MERAAAIYLRGQGREPAASIFDEVETTNPDPATLTVTSGLDGAPAITSGEPVIVPPDQQATAGELVQLPEVPTKPSGEGEGLPEIPATPAKPSVKGKAKEG